MAPDYDDVGILPDTAPLTALRSRIGQHLPGDDLLRHGSILAVATVVSGGLNYVFQVFMGRALGPEQYGVFGALFALFYLVSVLGRGLRFSASRFATELDEQGRDVAAFYRGLLTRSLVFGLVIFAALAIASPAISDFLDLASPWPVIIVAATVPPGLAVRANRGIYQGLQWFGHLGGYNVFLAVAKLIAGVALVVVGYGVYGALAALVIGTAIAFVIMTVHLRKRLGAPSVSLLNPQFEYRRIYRFVPPAVLAGFCLTVPMNVDVIVVKHFFASDQAGLYTSASVLGKVLFFLPMGISSALFPKVTYDNTKTDSGRMEGLFDRAMLYSFGVAGIGAAVYWFVPEAILGLLFGTAYTAAAPVLQWYGLAVLFFVSAMVILNFELARDRMRFVYLFAGMTVLEIGLMWVFHGSMIQIVQIILLVNAALLVVGIVEVKQ